MAAKQMWTFSFDRGTLKCNECELHLNKAFLKNKGDKSGEREVVVLAEQSFSPILPTKEEGRCLKICRLEFASLEELAKEWLDLSRKKEIVRGTVIMLGLLCHMQRHRGVL
jgi:hypothetical protein